MISTLTHTDSSTYPLPLTPLTSPPTHPPFIIMAAVDAITPLLFLQAFNRLEHIKQAITTQLLYLQRLLRENNEEIFRGLLLHVSGLCCTQGCYEVEDVNTVFNREYYYKQASFVPAKDEKLKALREKINIQITTIEFIIRHYYQSQKNPFCLAR